jgi:hypothetical protein
LQQGSRQFLEVQGKTKVVAGEGRNSMIVGVITQEFKAGLLTFDGIKLSFG